MKKHITKQGMKCIGLLFYAIAKADRSLTMQEYMSFSNSLEKEWKDYGNKSLELIKSAFKAAQKDNLDPESCFQSFVDYLNANPNDFSDKLKNLIFKSAHDIAYAFAKINKSELNLMARLSLAFKKIKE